MLAKRMWGFGVPVAILVAMAFSKQEARADYYQFEMSNVTTQWCHYGFDYCCYSGYCCEPEGCQWPIYT